MKLEENILQQLAEIQRTIGSLSEKAKNKSLVEQVGNLDGKLGEVIQKNESFDKRIRKLELVYMFLALFIFIVGIASKDQLGALLTTAFKILAGN